MFYFVEFFDVDRGAFVVDELESVRVESGEGDVDVG